MRETEAKSESCSMRSAEHPLLDPTMEERVHEPRNESSLKKPEQIRNRFSTKVSRKEHILANAHNLDQGYP